MASPCTVMSGPHSQRLITVCLWKDDDVLASRYAWAASMKVVLMPEYADVGHIQQAHGHGQGLAEVPSGAGEYCLPLVIVDVGHLFSQRIGGNHGLQASTVAAWA